MSKVPHADLILEYAKDCQIEGNVKPWKGWEWTCTGYFEFYCEGREVMTKYEFGRIERLQEELLYDDRDILSLHPYFEKHMDHMTSENLFGKCEIAAELAWRDKRIDELRDMLAAKQEQPK